MSLDAMTMSAVYGRLVDSQFLQFCHASPPRTLLPKFPFVLRTVHSSPLFSPCFPINIHRTNLSLSCRSFRPVKAAMASTPSSETETRPFCVLFVCLGNICRSPAAEAVFREIVKRRGLESKFKIDSAGTIDYHEGNQADPRMRAASKQRGIVVTSISRPIRISDFRDFDLILAMDKQNRDDIFEAFNRWRFKETLPFEAHKKVRLMCSYCKNHDETEVPDPYYGGPQGFEKVLDLLEDACESLLDNILNENSHILDS
ncbi:putative low molecular weight protein-tyrosine-phosphatase slr0328 isoform X2 [Telopea speciosissima]|uniref:putative low molecular weight protein-tyrosine-phosphatase slr0328 isoform X2 n=1 Tax=Telopea speciosissima TaxID=54955 RepID=UPI001CC6D17E|nr:putative low molecular weight protein-tyrosine-phosphatase slr0328 isoform X2 [Telopea speciosissima]